MNPLLKKAQPARSAGAMVVQGRNAFGVPVVAPHVLPANQSAGGPYNKEAWVAPPVYRPAPFRQPYQVVSSPVSYAKGRRASGDAHSDAIAELAARAADPSYEYTEEDKALLREATASDREVIARQNTAIINAVGSAILGGIAAINTAITSGNQVEIARIQAESAVQVQRLRNEALAASNPAEIARLQQQAADMAQINTLMQRLNTSSGGVSTNMLLIGGAAILGLGLVYFMARGGGARRNPSESGWPHYNPVMTRKRRGKRREKTYFKPSEVRRARRRGWRKAR